MGKLTIPSIMIQDSGAYECFVNNSLEKEIIKLKLNVIDHRYLNADNDSNFKIQLNFENKRNKFENLINLIKKN